MCSLIYSSTFITIRYDMIRYAIFTSHYMRSKADAVASLI